MGPENECVAFLACLLLFSRVIFFSRHPFTPLSAFHPHTIPPFHCWMRGNFPCSPRDEGGGRYGRPTGRRGGGGGSIFGLLNANVDRSPSTRHGEARPCIHPAFFHNRKHRTLMGTGQLTISGGRGRGPGPLLHVFFYEKGGGLGRAQHHRVLTPPYTSYPQAAAPATRELLQPPPPTNYQPQVRAERTGIPAPRQGDFAYIHPDPPPSPTLTQLSALPPPGSNHGASVRTPDPTGRHAWTAAL